MVETPTMEKGNSLLQTTAPNKLLCCKCSRMFTNISNLRKHMKTHNGLEFQCPICDKKFGQKVQLMRHMSLKHLGIKNHVCSQCDNRFGTKGNLLRHIKRVHHEESTSPFVCSLCNGRFKHKTSLSAHMKTHISKESDVLVMKDGKYLYKCDTCSSLFPRLSQLTKHMDAHSTEKHYKCPSCDEKFQLLLDLRRHLKSIHQLKCTSNGNSSLLEAINNPQSDLLVKVIMKRTVTKLKRTKHRKNNVNHINSNKSNTVDISPMQSIISPAKDKLYGLSMPLLDNEPMKAGLLELQPKNDQSEVIINNKETTNFNFQTKIKDTTNKKTDYATSSVKDALISHANVPLIESILPSKSEVVDDKANISNTVINVLNYNSWYPTSEEEFNSEWKIADNTLMNSNDLEPLEENVFSESNEIDDIVRSQYDNAPKDLQKYTIQCETRNDNTNRVNTSFDINELSMETNAILDLGMINNSATNNEHTSTNVIGGSCLERPTFENNVEEISHSAPKILNFDQAASIVSKNYNVNQIEALNDDIFLETPIVPMNDSQNIENINDISHILDFSATGTNNIDFMRESQGNVVLQNNESELPHNVFTSEVNISENVHVQPDFVYLDELANIDENNIDIAINPLLTFKEKAENIIEDHGYSCEGMNGISVYGTYGIDNQINNSTAVFLQNKLILQNNEKATFSKLADHLGPDRNTNKTALLRRVRTNKYNCKNVCKYCQSRFTNLHNLKMHQEIHTSQQQFICDECGKSLSSRRSLLAHLRLHNTKMRQCLVCGIILKENRMKNHNCSVQCTFCCAICGQSFLKKTSLDHHTVKNHSTSVDGKATSASPIGNIVKINWDTSAKDQQDPKIKTSSEKNTNIYVCDVCQNEFKRKPALDRHLKYIHKMDRERSFKCECGTSYYNRNDLLCHIRKFGNKPHQCPYRCKTCKETFSFKKAFIEHLKKSSHLCGLRVPRD